MQPNNTDAMRCIVYAPRFSYARPNARISRGAFRFGFSELIFYCYRLLETDLFLRNLSERGSSERVSVLIGGTRFGTSYVGNGFKKDRIYNIGLDITNLINIVLPLARKEPRFNCFSCSHSEIFT